MSAPSQPASLQNTSTEASIDVLVACGKPSFHEGHKDTMQKKRWVFFIGKTSHMMVVGRAAKDWGDVRFVPRLNFRLSASPVGFRGYEGRQSIWRLRCRSGQAGCTLHNARARRRNRRGTGRREWQGSCGHNGNRGTVLRLPHSL